MRHIPPHLRTGSEEQAAVLRVLKSTGWLAFSTSDPKVRRQTRGITDVIAFKPRRTLFWETKAGTGKLSEDQVRFGHAAISAGDEWGWGDAQALTQYLAAARPLRE